MKRKYIIRMIAGTSVLTGSSLSYYVDPHWIWLCVFVGINLLQSAFTKWCPLESVLMKLGIGVEA